MKWKTRLGAGVTALAAVLGVVSAPAATAAPVTALAAPDISLANIKTHLNQLQTIANNNGGTRSPRGAGYAASVTYVENLLKNAGYTTTRQTCTSCIGQSQNLIAEWPQGDAEPGHHARRAPRQRERRPRHQRQRLRQPSILETALTLAAPTRRWPSASASAGGPTRSRAWSARSTTSTTCPSAERTKIKTYLNFDMIGSKNWGYFVYDDVASVKAIFDEYFSSIGIQTEGDSEGDGRSDHASFKSAGIPIGGLATGAGDIKSSAQAQKWGGTAGAAFDNCYHRACDTTSNIPDAALAGEELRRDRVRAVEAGRRHDAGQRLLGEPEPDRRDRPTRTVAAGRGEHRDDVRQRAVHLAVRFGPAFAARRRRSARPPSSRAAPRR